MSTPDDFFFDRFPSVNRPIQLITAIRQLGTIGIEFESFTQALLAAGQIPPSLRELVILRVAYLRSSPYVYGGHALIAEDVGLRFPPPGGRWHPIEALSLAVADKLLAGTLDDTTRSRATDTLGQPTLVELALVVGQYAMVSMVVAALGLPPEPGCPAMLTAWPGSFDDVEESDAQ